MDAALHQIMICPRCQSEQLNLEVKDEDKEQVLAGAVICVKCGHRAIVEDGILDLLDGPADSPRAVPSSEKIVGVPRQHDAIKAVQKEFFDRTYLEYEQTVVNSKFYQALDRVTAHEWFQNNLSNTDHVLDVACGTARMTIPMARLGIGVVGIDISREMLLLGQQKAREAGVLSRVNFIRGDAERLPFRRGHFDAAIVFGSLHHIPDKKKTLISIGQVVKPGGRLYQLDPHKSPARFIFDFLMRVWHLYDEEADDDPLLTRAQLQQWLAEAGFDTEISYSTYLPPHLFHLLPGRVGPPLLKLSDALLRQIPVVRKLGGIICSSSIRQAG